MHSIPKLITGMCDPPCVNGGCVVPGVCLCDEGWIDEDCSRGNSISHMCMYNDFEEYLSTANYTTCEPACVNGVCNIDTRSCVCNEGWMGPSCTESKSVSITV